MFFFFATQAAQKLEQEAFVPEEEEAQPDEVSAYAVFAL